MSKLPRNSVSSRLEARGFTRNGDNNYCNYSNMVIVRITTRAAVGRIYLVHKGYEELFYSRTIEGLEAFLDSDEYTSLILKLEMS